MLIFSTIQFSFAQSFMVTGTVKDANGAELPGVNIHIKGTTQGTTTNLHGKYKIQVSKGDILVFSFVGYDTKQVPVTGHVLNVVLKESVNKLKEFVVTAFGMKQKTRSLGYSVTQVQAKNLDLGSQTNPLEALEGRVAGLQINRTSGSAGGGVDILIRGLSSIDPSRNNQPLIIVDGLAIDNETYAGNVLPSKGSNATGSSEQFGFSNRASDINPDDIASFSVLKGAAATALYGVRAANGAIIITTKKGQRGKPKINLSVFTTFRDVVKTPALQKVYREGNRTTKIPGAVIDPNSPTGYDRYGFAFYSWGVPFSANSFTMPDGTVIDLTHDGFHSPYELFRTGVNKQINFNISGADSKFNYFISTGWNKDDGILPNTSFEKKTFRVNAGYQILKNLNISSTVTYSGSGGARANGGDKSVFSSLSYWSSTFPINNYLLPNGMQNNYTNGVIDNPRYFLEKSNLIDNLDRWIGNVVVKWSPYQWMNVSYAAQFDNYAEKRNRFVPPDLDVGTQVHGFIVDENINFKGLESNLLVTFSHNWNEFFNSSLTIGNQVSETKRYYSYIRGENLNVPGINDLSNTLNTFAGTSLIRLRNVGVFGELKLGYKSKLYLSLTGRNDWVSTLPVGNNSFFYPSISAAYVFTQDIFKNSNIISFGKLRISWAQVGKAPGFGNVVHFFIPDPNFPFNGVGGYRSSTALGDPNIKPERDNSFEIGTNLQFFKNRLRFDYSFYNTNVTNQIFRVGTAYSSGLSGVTRNAGDYRTWGHEIVVSGDIIKRNGLRWEMYMNWSKNKGVVVALPKDLKEIVFFGDRITSKAKVGDALGTLYGWVFQTVPGGQRYVNPDGKWVITGSDNKGYYYTGTNQMVKVGNAFPDFVLSLGNNILWKSLSVNFLIEWKKGGSVYDRGFRNALRNGNLLETQFRDKTRILSGMMDDGHGGYVPNTIPLMITANSYYRDWNNYNNASEVLLQDGSWIKLRNISITYSLKGRMLKKTHLNKVSVTAGARNIIIWTPFKGFDPEANQFSAGSNIYGFTGLTVPLPQAYYFGINFGF